MIVIPPTDLLVIKPGSPENMWNGESLMHERYKCLCADFYLPEGVNIVPYHSQARWEALSENRCLSKHHQYGHHDYGKSACFMGKSTWSTIIKWPFSMALFNYQRASRTTPFKVAEPPLPNFIGYHPCQISSMSIFQHLSLHPFRPCSVRICTAEAWLKFQTAHGNRELLCGEGTHPPALEQLALGALLGAPPMENRYPVSIEYEINTFTHKQTLCFFMSI